MDATWLELRILGHARGKRAEPENETFSLSEARYSGKGPIMTFMTAILFGITKNVKLFLGIRWNSLSVMGVVCDSRAWNK